MEELTKKDILTILGENLTDIRHSGYKTEYSEEEDVDGPSFRCRNTSNFGT